MKRIGIDVGGTNTDAVLLDGLRVLTTIKSPTTPDVTTGIKTALAALIARAGPEMREAGAVIIGTTHFVNAVVERQRLNRVTAVRLCLPASSSLPPFVDWPSDLRELVQQDTILLPGGFEVDGREIAAFDDRLMEDAARRIADSGVEAVAVSGVFSPLRGDHELRAAEALEKFCPNVSVTLSRDLGRMGLMERENVAILNAALARLARVTTKGFREAIAASGLDARLYLTQNDGTVMSAEAAERAPVLCFSSGPTNSMRGAASLSGVSDAIVIDVGGTTSDIGMLVNGFPRQANGVVEVGGVRTLFRMPDVLCLPLGGGTRVHADPLRLGPDSVGYRLTELGRVFGGDVLTATDLGVAAGRAAIGARERVADVPSATVRWFEAAVASMLENGIESSKTRAGDIPLLAVGGGSFLIPPELKGVSEVLFVEHHDVANAVGAAMAKISGEVDQIFSDVGREDAIRTATALAQERARDAGADPGSIETIEIEDLPMAYMPGNSRRVRVRVAGELADV
ncbi:hydantoinase/oxoprolinase N-terminal domain-containing protein [Sphingosinicella soli]|uniref:N-methylhydantoinase A/oxoprolinase/acetone carboxylase beta subunit n=1 Tax=Sphingosinicella soli TaxID=333708 RepID=A0A7W7F9Y8_9SPHN|nr:hydantoinase/oxoprolinase family protein [Sphingosinicella soli]MBB4633158.1 N-methylhydantoinase A/oxoprolinase/acetone carboxylase beta subunit [Sphingosinicella soli]